MRHMTPALICLSVLLHDQSVERVNDIKVRPTGFASELKLDRLWSKVDGEWYGMSPFNPIPSTVDGRSAMSRQGCLRICAVGFKRGESKMAALSLLTYTDFQFDGGTHKVDKKKGWVLDATSVHLLIIVLSGSLGAVPSTWNKAADWELPVAGVLGADWEEIAKFEASADHDLFKGVDQYVAKEVPAKWSTLSPSSVVWPVFPAAPSSGQIIRLLMPTEPGFKSVQDWEKMYYEVLPADWKAFTGDLKKMLAT